MLSFDITDRNIRIIKGSENNGKIRISSAATLNLEEEVIVNGHVRDVPRLATLINQVLRTNKMPDKEAIVSISSNMTIFKELHIQKAEKQTEFMKMVRAEMSATLGIDDSYSISYIIVGDSDQTDGAVKVLATACPFEVVDCYKRVFNMLQINLRSVMIGCNCITKVLLADTKVKAKMPLLAVQIDNNFISLNLYESGQLSFSRFASISAEDYDDSEDYVFEAVNENIFRMLQFQKSKSGSDPIENVIFYGDTREYVRITNELEKMGIRTSIINVPPQIHGYENLEFSSYANAVGAMFKRNKETERINLLETDTVNNNKLRSDSSYFAILGISALAAVALVGGVWMFLNIQNSGVKKEINTLNDKINSDLAKQLDNQLSMLNDKEKAVNTYVDGVTDAFYAFNSRPKPTKAQYEEIDNTIAKTVAGVFDCTEEEAKEKYEFKTLNYSMGTFGVALTLDRDTDEPMPTLPSKLITALRGLSDVESVNYTGYTLKEEKLDDDAAKKAAEAQQQQAEEAEEGEDDEAEKKPAAPQNQNEEEQLTKKTIEMNMNIVMKGGNVDLTALNAEKEAE